MPRGLELTLIEQTQIKCYYESNLTITQIASRIHRHRNTVSNFLKNAENYKTKKRSGRKPVVTIRGKREICRLAVSKQMSAGEIQHQLELNVTKRRVQQIISANEHIGYKKKLAKPKLTKKHKAARLQFADAHKFWDEEWQSVIFSDEKKFNLDGPDGTQMIWQDLRLPRQTRIARHSGGGSLMVWAAMSYRGKTPICFVTHKMNAENYVELLDSELITFGEEYYGDNWTFQQDNAPIHSAHSVKDFFNQRSIQVLKWPAISPDLNPIENLWGILAQAVYKNGRQFETLKNLKHCIVEEWDKIHQNTLQNLVESMPRRLNSVILNKGSHTKY